MKKRKDLKMMMIIKFINKILLKLFNFDSYFKYNFIFDN